MLHIPADAEKRLSDSPSANSMGSYLRENVCANLVQQGLLDGEATPDQLLDALESAFYSYELTLDPGQLPTFRSRQATFMTDVIKALIDSSEDREAIHTAQAQRASSQ